MKTINLLYLLLSFCCCICFATTLQAADTETKKVTVKNADNVERYYVLKSDPTIKHGEYAMEGFHWKAEGQYIMGQRTGIWSFYGHDAELESQYDFTNLKQTYQRQTMDTATTKVNIGGAYAKREVDSKPFLLGGTGRMWSIFGSNMRYPAAAQRAGAMGTVVIAVELSETGQVLNYKLEKSVGYGLDEEAIRVFKLIPNDWFPAIAAGKPVRSIFYLPLRFSIK